MRRRMAGIGVIGAIAATLLVVLLPSADAAPAEAPEPLSTPALGRAVSGVSGSVCPVGLTTDGHAGYYVVRAVSDPRIAGLYERNFVSGAERRIVSTAEVPDLSCGGVVSGDGQRYAYCASECPGPVRVLDLSTGGVTTVPPVSNQPIMMDGFRFSDDHRYLFYAQFQGNVQRYDTLTGAQRTVAFISEVCEPLTAFSTSADGERIAWQAKAGDGQVGSVWWMDLRTGQALPVSFRDGQQVNGAHPRITPDGSHVLYDQTRSGGGREVVRWSSATDQRIVVSQGVGGAAESGSSRAESLSADGRYATFTSTSTNLTSGITYPPTEGVPPLSDFNDPLFLRDLTTGSTTLISRSVNGAVPADSGAAQSSIDRAGRTVVFSSPATDLVDGWTVAGPQAYAYDVRSGALRLLSTSDSGTTTEPYRVEDPVISGSGGRVLLPRYISGSGAQLPYVARVETDPTTLDIARIAGRDRYETAAQLSTAGFPGGAMAAFVASGEAFPDALAAGPAASAFSSPVLLTTRDALPASTVEELRRLRPAAIFVIGGPAAVSDRVVQLLGQYVTGTFPMAQRVSGPDRYATAVAISQRFFGPGVSKVHVASALNFADALAGGAAAAQGMQPVLLTHPDALPPGVATEIARLGPDAIDVLGGPAAISEPVVHSLAQLAPTARRSGADRYATSAAISAGTFSAPVERLYLATGLNFPDGLAAAGVARRHGSPVLLVPNWCIPASVAAEAARLQPRRVILLGGPGAIHPAVLAGQPCPT